jgi:hypothetical protein
LTTAVCLCCGEQKFGAFVQCGECSYAPLTGWELSISVICSDQLIPIPQLRSLAAHIGEDRNRGIRHDWRFDKGADVYITQMFDEPSWRDMLTLTRGAESGLFRRQMNWHFTGPDGDHSEIVTRGKELPRTEFNAIYKDSGADAFFVEAYNQGSLDASPVSKRRWYCARDINFCVSRRAQNLTLEAAVLNSEALNFTLNYLKRKDGIDLNSSL